MQTVQSNVYREREKKGKEWRKEGKEEKKGKKGRECSCATNKPRPGWAPDPLMVGIRSPNGLVVGSCTSHPGVLGSIPKREEPGKTGAPCVKVPVSSRVPVRDGQTSPHWPRLVVSRSTCPPLSPPPHANSFVLGPAVINTHTLHTHVLHCQHSGWQPSSGVEASDFLIVEVNSSATAVDAIAHMPHRGGGADSPTPSRHRSVP